MSACLRHTVFLFLLFLLPLQMVAVDFATSWSWVGPSAVTDVVIADFNGDGVPDVAMVDLMNEMLVFLNGGTELQIPMISTLLWMWSPVHLIAADIKGDGKLDLITGEISTHWQGE